MNGLSNKVNFLGRAQKLTYFWTADRTADRITNPWTGPGQDHPFKSGPVCITKIRWWTYLHPSVTAEPYVPASYFVVKMAKVAFSLSMHVKVDLHKAGKKKFMSD